MNDDLLAQPNADDQAPPAPPEPEPQAPQFGVEDAYRVIAENEGWDPRLARFEFEELKRRKQEIERRERDWEERAKPTPRYQPEPEFIDPGQRYLYDRIGRLEEMLTRREQAEEERRQQQEHAQELGSRLRSSYENSMRSRGMDDQKIEQGAQRFFAAMERVYPDGIPASVGPDGAVEIVHSYLGSARATTPQWNGQPSRDRRAPIVIPGSSAGATTSAPMGFEKQPGETDEQYGMRISALIAGSGIKTLPNGRVSSG